MSRKPTIYEVLRAKLGREPTHGELVADVKRILASAVSLGHASVSHGRGQVFMSEHDCEECGEPATETIEREPCSDDCSLGCNHPTRDHHLCADCANTPSTEAADRAYRRAEQGHCE